MRGKGQEMFLDFSIGLFSLTSIPVLSLSNQHILSICGESSPPTPAAPYPYGKRDGDSEREGERLKSDFAKVSLI